MNDAKKMGATIAFITIAMFIVVGLIISVMPDDNYNTKADGFTIESYNVVLDVKEDNKIDVTENITVNFTNAYKHGIYKFTPTWLKYTGKNGKTIRRYSEISNYRAEGDPYTVDTINKKERIKIGSANQYVGEGLKEYTIKYTYDMGKDPYKGFDELIFHTFGDYWGTEIKNASVEVNMPKSIEGYKVNFFTDKYRKNNVKDYVNYQINGNTLYLTYDGSEKPLDKSLTIDIELPEGYFVGGSWHYGFISMIISFVILGITAITIIRWFKHGKDYDKPPKTVEFYPPENLNAAEIGYIYNRKELSKKFTIALIVELASKGYIRIDELADKNKSIQITNLLPISRTPGDFQKELQQREIVINKLKDIGNDLSADETTMMKYLFLDGNTKKINSNIEKFLDVENNLINKGYIKVVSDNEESRHAELESAKAKYDEMVKKYNIDTQNRDNILTTMPALTSMEQIVYDCLFQIDDVVILSEHPTFYTAFNDVSRELKNTLDSKLQEDVVGEILSAVARNLVIVILALVSYCYVEDLAPNLSILYYVSFMCIPINLLFTILMPRKTKYGELITSRVLGFRDFLVTAEKPKLEALVAENPRYYYDILPYTYALNISKKWIKKFENIPMPTVDMGSFDYGSDSSYSHLYDDVHFPAPTYSGSSGSSSCGGGCSSCGGGCSSCGGGGSW